jgi:hypothetical protein
MRKLQVFWTIKKLQLSTSKHYSHGTQASCSSAFQSQNLYGDSYGWLHKQTLTYWEQVHNKQWLSMQNFLVFSFFFLLPRRTRKTKPCLPNTQNQSKLAWGVDLCSLALLLWPDLTITKRRRVQRNLFHDSNIISTSMSPKLNSPCCHAKEVADTACKLHDHWSIKTPICMNED